MKEDKKLQSILTNYGMQETSEGFDNKLMQKIAAIKLHGATSKPLLGKTMQRVFVVAFIIAALLLIVIAFLVNPDIFAISFLIEISQKTYTQVFSFFAAFWIVMCLNVWWNKTQLNSQYH